MRNVRKILVALCLSENSRAVFDTAADMARAFGASLLAVNVINVRDVKQVASVEAMGYDVHSRDYTRAVKEEHREEMARLIAGSGFPPERVATQVMVGHPVERILETIREEKADLLVIGSKGVSNLPQLLVGSVAEKLFRHSPVTVVCHR